MITYSIITPSEITDLIGQIQNTFYSDGDNLVENINQAILTTVEINKNFSVFVEVRIPTSNLNAPPEIMFLHKEFRGRGFFTEYKIIEQAPQDPEEEVLKMGLFTVSWSNPDIGSYDIQSRPYWNLDLVEQIGKGGRAWEYYLCLTGGLDLRRYTQNSVVYDIRQKITNAALQTQRVISYNGPNSVFAAATDSGNGQLEAAIALGNLYAEAIDYLTEAGYTVLDSTLPWVISSPSTM